VEDAVTITVRFLESQYYDINIDAEVVRFTATMSSGSYWTEIPAEGPRGLRRDRQEFKDTVVELIRAGQPPCYVEMSGDELH